MSIDKLAPAPITPSSTPAIDVPALRPAPLPKMRKPPPKIRAAIEAMLAGKAYNLTQAAKVAGTPREYLSRAWGRPEVRAWATNKARRILDLGACVATPKMVELSQSSSQRVSFEAARHLLAIAGMAPANQSQVSVNVELRAGWVINLAPENEEERRMIERQAKVIDATAD